jgi:GNAT superfamily N-acetyltransferase
MNTAMTYKFEKATLDQVDEIWTILSAAILRRKADGSNQWQDGYPNLSLVKSDIEHGFGYVVTSEGLVVAYCALIFNNEPAYADIEGTWLSNGDFLVLHRVAVAKDYLGKGLTKYILKSIEDVAIENQVFSIRADTNFDNAAMLALFEKNGYAYCGEVYFRGSPRKAFEKVLTNSRNNDVKD